MAEPAGWQDVLRTLTDKSTEDGTLDKFSTIKSNQEQVHFLLHHTELKTLLREWILTFSRLDHVKSAEMSQTHRLEGNRFHSQNDNFASLEAYTKSILCAPTVDQSPEDNSLALGYANRSAALFHLQKFGDAIADVDRALRNAYPRELEYKLLHRKGLCCLHLKKAEEAATWLRKALDSVKHATLLTDARKARLKDEMSTLLDTCTKEKNNSKEEDQAATDEDKEDTMMINESELPPLFEGLHSKLESVSSVLQLENNSTQGRHFVTNSCIPAGSTLLVEKAFTSILLPQHYETHCHHCYRRVLATIPCRRCSQVRFCSDECEAAAWSRYHKHECFRLDLLHSIGIAHLALRLLLNVGISQLIALEPKLDSVVSPSGVSGLNEQDEYVSSYYSVYHLLTHDEHMVSEDKFLQALTCALVITEFESDVGNSEHNLSSSSVDQHHSLIPAAKEDYIGSLLLRHIQQLICNAHAITDVLFTNDTSHGDISVRTQEQVRIATAIFPSASLLNHSCDPNIIASFYKNWLIVRAMRDIESGEDVLNCYGPHHQRMSRDERQAALKLQYFFDCHCGACESESKMSVYLDAFRCLDCGGPVMASADGATCRDCQKTQDCEKQKKKWEESNKLFQNAMELLTKKRYKGALKNLKECLEWRTYAFYPGNKNIGLVWDAMAKCHSLKGDFGQAHSCLKHSMQITTDVYGTCSIEYAHELQKVSDVLMQLVLMTEVTSSSTLAMPLLKERLQEALFVTEEGLRVFTVLYGDWHEATREFVDKRRNLADIERIFQIQQEL